MKRSLWLILLSAACILTLTLALTLTGCSHQGNDPTDTPPVEGGQSAAGLESITGETAEYTSGYVDISMTLPEGWRWEAVQTRDRTEGLRFWKEGDKALDFELFCWTEGYGICGTGVTSEEITLPSGQKLWQHTEEMESGLWLNIVFSDVPGSYVLRPVGETIDAAAWESCRSEVLTILDTVQLGRGIMTEQQAINAAAERYAGEYAMAYGSFDVKSGTWTVRFSTGETGSTAAVFTIAPNGDIAQVEA